MRTRFLHTLGTVAVIVIALALGVITLTAADTSAASEIGGLAATLGALN